MPTDEPLMADRDLTRRDFIGASAVISGIVIGETSAAGQTKNAATCSITINGSRHELKIEPRTTLLDLLREHLHMPGTKKGCDHGQCGACTVIANGERILSCLSLAIAQDGGSITTIEGLARDEDLHPMQEAFLEYDGFQCGFCTSGQICSAVAMLKETRDGMPSAVSKLAESGQRDLTDAEIRERMAGNICRCGAYPNIIAAIRALYQGGGL